VTTVDIQSIERATLSAVSPQAVEEIPGWLLPFDSGTVGRAKSAVPLSHDAPDPSVLAQIEARYAAHGLPAALRIPEAAAFATFREALERRAFEGGRPTQVHWAALSDIPRARGNDTVLIAPAPADGWASVFLGEGFDPVDGASRVKTLSRAPQALFASVREEGRTVAAGMASFSHGWASVHGMRTAQDCRGRGLAQSVLAALADAARAKGYERMFLQVEAHNAAALALYRRCGFKLAWTYAYWLKTS
jgi:ribosomal protein S18 acetylase RimI-like enzyme